MSDKFQNIKDTLMSDYQRESVLPFILDMYNSMPHTMKRFYVLLVRLNMDVNRNGN